MPVIDADTLYNHGKLWEHFSQGIYLHWIEILKPSPQYSVFIKYCWMLGFLDGIEDRPFPYQDEFYAEFLALRQQI